MRLVIPGTFLLSLRRLLVIPRPKVNTGISFLKWKDAFLFLMPLTGFLGVPVLPTWRIANIFYVLIGAATLRLEPGIKVARNLFWMQLLFLFAIGVQYLCLGPDYPFSFYDVSWVISILFLFALSHLFFFEIQNRLEKVLSIFGLIASLNIVYQVYQQIMVQLKLYSLATILNEHLIAYHNTFFKIIGGVLGSPGFMAEAGHLALFIAPLIGFQLVADYYGVLPLNRKRVLIMLVSLALTISSGAFMQFVFLAFLMLLIYRKRLNQRNLMAIAGLLVLIAASFALFEEYRSAILYRFDSVFEQDSARFMGAKVYWEIFQENMWLGMGPKSARFIGADPNFFITSVLADHGLVAGIPLFLLYFLPVLLAFWWSERKLFVYPYFAMTVHLFLAYGTFTWGFIWMHIALTIWGLTYARPQLLPNPNPTLSV